ncbi:MAG: RsmB/NOP family class I SAM-dependent RNA methyltransferase [Pirellulales bacterium]
MTATPVDLDAIRAQLPAEFLERLAQVWNTADELTEVLRSFAVPKRVGFRVNPLRGDAEGIWAELLGTTALAGGQYGPGLTVERIPWLPEAGIVERAQRQLLLKLPATVEGRIYVQGLSSMLAVMALDPRPGQEILDLAAAPGGKTLMIAARMQQQGRLAAVEAVRERFYKLQANLRHYGADQVKTYLADGRTIGAKTPGRFDAVLLDAPCSAEARFHIDRPESWARWSLRKVREQARKQVGLLRSALESVRVGGHVLYCTCSMAPEENELVIQHQLDAFPESVEIEEMELPISRFRSGLTAWGDRALDPRLARARRLIPDATWDAFFLCRLVKIQPLPHERSAGREHQSRQYPAGHDRVRQRTPGSHRGGSHRRGRR